MVRAALRSKRRIGEGPVAGAEYVPIASVVVASFLSGLPIMSQNGWFPEFGFMVLIAWRLLRANPWPVWATPLLGLVNDLVTGNPLGLSVSVWTIAIIALDFADRRTMWRDYWIEWALAALLILLNEWAQWQVAAWMGAVLPLATIIPPVLIATASFPLFAWSVSRLDRWRLRRP